MRGKLHFVSKSHPLPLPYLIEFWGSSLLPLKRRVESQIMRSGLESYFLPLKRPLQLTSNNAGGEVPFVSKTSPSNHKNTEGRSFLPLKPPLQPQKNNVRGVPFCL